MDDCKKKIRRGPAQEAFRREAKERQWKFEEKKALLKALRKYGSKYMEFMLPAVPMRSEFEVRNYLKARKKTGQYRYWNLPYVKRRKYERKCKKRQQQDEPPLLKWLNVLVKKIKYLPPPDIQMLNNPQNDESSSQPYKDKEPVGTICVDLYHLKRTLLFICAYEKHPLPEHCYGICFRELYRTLYYYVSGDPPPWFSSFRNHSVFLATYKLLSAVITESDLEEEFAFFNSVQTLPGKMSFHPNMKTYLRKPPPPDAPVGAEKCNILNIPSKLLKLDNNHFDRFVSTFNSPHRVLAWLNMFYNSDCIAQWNKQTWEEVTQFMMKHLYNYTQNDMYYNYKFDVTLTPWKYFASDDARMYSLEDNIELFKLFFLHAYLKGQKAQDYMYSQMQETETCFNSASMSVEVNEDYEVVLSHDDFSKSFMSCSVIHDYPYD